MRRRTSAITVRWRGLFCFCATLLLALIISGTSIAEEVTIDNGDSGTSSTGSWSVSGALDPYGADSLWSKTTNGTYSFESVLSGYYEVSLWWTEWLSRCTNVPVKIYDGTTLIDTVYVNQQQNTGQWNLLGSYNFQNGSGRVTITSVDGSCSTCADAVRFVSTEAPELNSISIEGPSEVQENSTADYRCRAHYSDGSSQIVDADSWSDNCTYGDIGPNGQLTTSEVESDEQCRITSAYTEGSTENAVLDITITNFIPSSEVIIDDGDSGTSSTGTWSVSGGPDPYGDGSLWSKTTNGTYSFESVLSGYYEVSLWWTEWSSRCTNVPVKIYDGTTLIDTVYVNQQDNGGQWNLLGPYNFQNGSGRVTITSVDGSCSTCADAVRFFSGVPAELDYIEIEGPSEVVENTSATYVCRAYYKNGTDHIVDTDTWAVKPPSANATISSSGILTADEVESDEFCEVTVFYAEGDSNGTATRAVTILDFVSPPEVIIDNGGSGTSSTGSWSVSGALDPYGANSLYSKTLGSTYTFETALAGPYDVFFRWTGWSSRCTAVPVEVYDGEDLIASLDVNQQENASKWYFLGTYSFSGTARVRITAVGSICSTCVDAVRFISGVPAELNYIEIEGPSEVVENTSATYVCRAYYTNGTDHIVDTDTWAIDPPTANATISSSGILTAGEVESDEVCEVTVLYTEGDVTRNASHPVTILDFVSPPPEVIVDNGDPGTSSTGSWSVSGAPDPYGTESLWSRNGASYTWHADIPELGVYAVYMWWTEWPSRSDNVSVTVDNYSSSDVVEVNQKENGGQWNFLGQYGFDTVSGATITLSAPDAYPVSYCADAVRFVHLPDENIAPVATIESINPNPCEPGQTITFTGSGTDLDGEVVAYNWESSIDGVLSELPTFSTFTLSEGIHTIFFKVRDEQGNWSEEVRETLDVMYQNPPTEHIYICFGYNWEDLEPQYDSMLQDIGASKVGSLWAYTNSRLNKTFVVHYVKNMEEMSQALKTEDSHIIYAGHSNYGLGPAFATKEETRMQIIEDILYVDDPRIFNISTEWIHVRIPGMRTGQAYPFWWCDFQDGESAVMPYDWSDPAEDPPYNYYLTYQLPGDSTYYKIETVRRGALERFPYSSYPWYSSAGEGPDPYEPDHMQHYITNPEPWYPSFEAEGNWNEIYTGLGFFKENYIRTSPGDGSTVARFLLRIPEAGRYKIFGWWPALNDNTTNAPFAINHASGNATVTSTVYMNQRVNGGQWNELGEFDFNVQEYSVDLSNDVSSGNVVADGVRVAHIGNPPEIVRANFYARPLRGSAPLDVRFYNISTGDLTDREWDFGEGFTNDTRDSITHTYSNPGIYTVRLTVSGPMGSDTITRSALIWVDQPEPPLQAEFSASNRTGIYPLEVRFRDRSAGNITDWYWYFGDGTNSTEPDPRHEYSFPGIYTVSLTVSDTSTGETSTETKEDLVRVVIYDNNIDNVDYPKVHFGSKTILFRKELEIQPDEMRYSRMLYDSCNSGNYYLGTLHRGITFYTLAGSGSRGSVAYLKAYFEGKSDYEIWETIQDVEYVYDYFDFNRLAQ